SSGVLTEIKVKEGETVPVNTVVAVIDGGGAKTAAPAERAVAPAPATETRGPAPAAAASTPAAPTPAAPAHQGRPAGSQAAAPAETRDERPPSPPPAPAERPAGEEEITRTRSSPLVRKIAAEHGVDISQIEGTGLAGRVTKNDILSFIENQGAAGRPAPAGTSAAPAPRTEPVPAKPEPAVVRP